MSQPGEPRVIVPEDNGTVDGDSAMDVPIESTVSLRSSILQYQQENGRTYHALSEGKYILPNDEGEQERLGTGMWAMDFADAHPDAEVVGVDLSPIQPTSVPPNCRFEVDDLEQEWTWDKSKFDLIFSRGLAGSFANWPSLIKQSFHHLQPGGYLEIHDNLFPPLSDDGSLPADSALVRWCTLATEGARRLGRSIDEVPYYPTWLKDAGFEDVQTKVFRWPINRWPKDPGYKELGAWTLTAMDGGLEGLSMAVFTRGLGWSKEETMAFCSQVRKDFRNTNYHAYWKIVVTYGRKPGKPKAE